MVETPHGSVAHVIAAQLPSLIRAGAQAVLLVGSQARGDAQAHADIDLIVIGDGPHYRVQRAEPHLLSLSWRTPDALRTEMRTPRACASTVPGLRSARLLHDPDGVAHALQQEALAWSWQSIGDDVLDAWVAEELCGYAEEVQKLVGATLAGGHAQRKGTIQRSILALRLAIPLSVHLRLLYASEDHLWSLVDARMGAEWQRAQAVALGEAAEPAVHTSPDIDGQTAAAGELFVLACRRVDALFDARQRAVVNHAIQLLTDAGLRLTA